MSEGPSARDRLAMGLLRLAPKGGFSRGVGWLSRVPVPRTLRAPIYAGFARAVGADLDAVDRPLDEFERFDDFFTRPHRDGARPIAEGQGILVSPVDGVASELGTAEAGRCIQCKGLDYSIADLLADPDEAARFSGGTYATLYLAPRNYHRIHSPIEGGVVAFRHIPGGFYPVNRIAVGQVRNLFAINERIVSYLETPAGRVAVVKVAATGVGHISLSYEAGVASHARGALGRLGTARSYAKPLPVERGGELGMFHLGSTVILLFEPNRVELDLVRGQDVALGQPIGRVR